MLHFALHYIASGQRAVYGYCFARLFVCMTLRPRCCRAGLSLILSSRAVTQGGGTGRLVQNIRGARP
jgi:hypothetical protein